MEEFFRKSKSTVKREPNFTKNHKSPGNFMTVYLFMTVVQYITQTQNILFTLEIVLYENKINTLQSFK